MTVGGGVAVAGEMFVGDEHGIAEVRVRAVDERGDVAGDSVGILAVGADVDDGVVGVAVDVGVGGEDPVDAEGSGFAGGFESFEAGGRQVVGCSVGHVVGKS